MKRNFIKAIMVLFILVLGTSLVVKWAHNPSGEESSMNIRLYRHATGEVKVIDISEYLAGVVAAEMPARFPEEALKAQAVAARTYVLKRIYAGGVVNNNHPGADVCDDHRHAQAFISREEMREKWGVVNYYRYYYKIRKAVDDTQSMVITYNGELIDPVYHSACGGRTEDSGEVWKYSIPYLASVDCTCGNGQEQVREKSFTPGELEEALGMNLDALPVSGGESPVKITACTESGRVKTVEAAGMEIPATVLRERLGLRSTGFECSLEDGKIIFTTNGYGHGVGMCQYGARDMAQEGGTYRDILTHYYTGVTVEEW